MRRERFCFKHHPEKHAARLMASVKGGQHRKRPATGPGEPTALRSIDDALVELEALADDAKRLHHGAERIKVLTAIVRTPIDAHTDHTLERRWSASDSHRDACKALGADFADYRMHDARHSYAVRAIRAGAPLEHVATQLGHADTQMVVKVYGRYKPNEHERRKWEEIAALQDLERAKGAAGRGA